MLPKAEAFEGIKEENQTNQFRKRMGASKFTGMGIGPADPLRRGSKLCKKPRLNLLERAIPYPQVFDFDSMLYLFTLGTCLQF